MRTTYQSRHPYEFAILQLRSALLGPKDTWARTRKWNTILWTTAALLWLSLVLF